MAQPGEWTTDRLTAALSGSSPLLLRRLSVGIALRGGPTEPPGSCVLVVGPAVRRLGDLPRERRLGFLGDLDLLGEAVHHVCLRRDPGFGWVDLEVTGAGAVLLGRVLPRYTTADPPAPDGAHDDAQLMDELDRICAAGRADYPARHVYGVQPTRRSVYHHLP